MDSMTANAACEFFAWMGHSGLQHSTESPASGTLDPPFPDHDTSTLVFSTFADVVGELGGRPDALLEECGIDPVRFSDPTARICQRRASALLETTASRLGCSDLGLRLAARQSMPQVLKPLDPLFTTAPTVRDAFHACSRHIQAYVSGVIMNLDEAFGPDRTLLNLHFFDPLALSPQLIEMLVLLAHDSAIYLSSGFGRSREVRFSHLAVSLPVVYAQHFDAVVRFDQEYDGIVFGNDALEARVSELGAERFATEEERVSREYPVCTDGAGLETRLAVFRLLAGSEDCTRRNVANRLGMQERTLNRRLAKEGTSFEAIRDDVRRTLAYRYLNRADLSLTEITGKLGYSELAVLSRSCRRWFGASPRRLRRAIVSDGRAPQAIATAMRNTL